MRSIPEERMLCVCSVQGKIIEIKCKLPLEFFWFPHKSFEKCEKVNERRDENRE